MKKKILAMALSFTLAFSMAACGSPQVSGPVDRDIPVHRAGYLGTAAGGHAESQRK